jgi:hypothetical protein
MKLLFFKVGANSPQGLSSDAASSGAGPKRQAAQVLRRIPRRKMAYAKKTIDLGGQVRLGGRQRSIARCRHPGGVSTSAWPVRFATMSATRRQTIYDQK